MADYDVIVIGAGPGGYVCAIRCAQLGLKTACVEGRETLGGTCLNIGCIPSKALLHASELYHEAHDTFEKMGLMGGEATKIDVPKLQAYKQSTVDSNTKGVEFLFKKNKIDWLKGWGRITAPGEVTVGDAAHKTKNIVIASGSEVTPLRGVTIDEKTIVSSTGALTLAEVPKRLAVIGAGVIGLELGSVYARLGSEVTVLEFLDQITPGMDLEICKALQKQLAQPGPHLRPRRRGAVRRARQGRHPRHRTSSARTRARPRSTPTSCWSPPAGAPTSRASAEVGIEMTERGQVKVDARWRTERPRHLRHRRRHPRADARPQGRGRGHGGGRDHRRPARPRELRRDPERHLHLPRGRRRRGDRGGAEGGRAAPTRSASSRSWATPAPRATSWATAS